MGNITSKSAIGASQVTNAGTTSNDADEEIDLYISDNLTVLIDDGNAATITDVTAAFDWTRNGLFVLKNDSPAPTGAITITVPDTPRARVTFKNETAFDATVTIAGQSETADVVTAGTAAVFASDGSNIRIAGGGGGAGDFVSLSDTPGTIAANQFVKGNGAGDALVFGNPAGDALPFTLSPTWRGAHIHLATASTGLDLTTETKVPFDTALTDTDSMFNDANDSIDIPAGVTRIFITGQVQLNNAGVDGDVFLRLQLNGANIEIGRQPLLRFERSAANAAVFAQVHMPMLPVTENDQITLNVICGSDTSVDIDVNSFLHVGVIETADTVPSLRTVVASLPARQRWAKATKSAAQALTTATVTKVTFDATEVDTDGLFDDANDQFVVPAGVKTVSLYGGIEWEAGGTGYRQVFFQKDDAGFVGQAASTFAPNSATAMNSNIVARNIPVAEGDTFQLKARHAQGADLDVQGVFTTWFAMVIEEFNSSTDAVQAYIAVPPEHQGVLLKIDPAQSIGDTTPEDIAWTAATEDTGFDPGDGGPAQRFWLGPNWTFVDGDVTTGTDQIAETAHGYQTGEGPVRLTSSGTLPTGLALDIDYWIIRVDANNLKFASSRANALAGIAVDITAAGGGGTHTVDQEEYIVVPAGISRVSVNAQIDWSSASSVGYRTTSIMKRDAADAIVNYPGNGTNSGNAIFSSIRGASTVEGVAVSEGDRFAIRVVQTSGGALDVDAGNSTWFGLRVVEESRAITYPGVTVTPPFRGAVAKRVTTQSGANYSAGALVPFDGEEYDTDGFHDNATNNTRLTIPSCLGITKVRLSGGVFVANLSSSNYIRSSFSKNGGFTLPGNGLQQVEISAATTVYWSMVSAVIEVVGGDYFELWFDTESDTSVDVTADGWFSIEVVETDENAFPPEPVEFFINGTPGTSDLIYQTVAARRFTLSDDFAGSEAYLETAPSGGALVFDVDRNGAKIGEIQFADGVKTATFTTTAGSAEVFDVGDRLGIDSPANLFSAADLSIALWAWRS